MRKRTTLNKLGIIMSVITVAVISILSIRQVVVDTTHEDALSKEEIDVLREQYPVNDWEPGLICTPQVPLEEYIQICDCFVEVEIVGEPVTFVRTVAGAGGPTQVRFTKYEAKIITDIFDRIQGDTIEIVCDENAVMCAPAMEAGARFVIGNLYNEEEGTLGIAQGHTMFYVTEDGYVLSVKSEESKNRHTGSTVEDLIDYIKAEKGY